MAMGLSDKREVSQQQYLDCKRGDGNQEEGVSVGRVQNLHGLLL